jgi:hypothetical protein
MPLIATIPLCGAYIQPAQTKLPAMEASALGSTEMDSCGATAQPFC